MKERMLVLAKAAPLVNRKYDHLVCVAGITDKGEWRRIYPVPFETFWKGGGFKKKSWIEYDLKSDKPSDHRTESRKLVPGTVKQLKEAEYKEIRVLIQGRLTTLENLASQSHKEVSLGVIKPHVLDFYSSRNKHYKEMLAKSRQQTLAGRSAVKIDVPEMEFSYVFNCGEGCSTKHDMLCEDWEVAELYRKCEAYRKAGKYPDRATVLSKVRDKMLGEMTRKRELYFVVGTHVQFGTYMVIGVVYPRKADVL